MQDLQNIPNPDVNSTETEEDFGGHSDIEQDLEGDDLENPKNTGTGDIENPDESIPLPPDVEPQAPIEDPPVEENQSEPKRIV
jgi:hypothetical protein